MKDIIMTKKKQKILDRNRNKSRKIWISMKKFKSELKDEKEDQESEEYDYRIWENEMQLIID